MVSMSTPTTVSIPGNAIDATTTCSMPMPKVENKIVKNINWICHIEKYFQLKFDF